MKTEIAESPNHDSTARRIALGGLSFLAGAAFLCTFYVLQKWMIGAPMVAQGFVVPLLFGGGTGLAIGWLFHTLTRRVRHSKIESALSGQAAEAIRQSEGKYRELLQNANSIILRWDKNGHITFFNEFAQSFFGFTEEEILGQHVVGTIVPETESTGRDLRPLMDDIAKHPLRHEYNVNENIRKNGERVWIAWTNKVFLDSEGNPTGALSIGTDITERRRDEEELRFQAMLLDSISDQVTATDLEGRITYVNQAECKSVGKSREELVGKLVEVYGEDPNEGATQREIVKTTREKGEWRGEVVNFTSSGERVVVEMRTWLLRDEKGKPTGMCGIAMDVTDRKRAEEARELLIEELEVKNAELERFTYTVSHDLKSPLVTINGFLGVLKQDAAAGNTEAVEEDMAFIFDATRRMERLLEELLELSRIGRQDNPPERIELADLAQRVVSMSSEQMTERDIQVEISPDLPVVFGDRLRLWEVLQNLVDNAAKFIGDQPCPRIEIGSRRDGEETVCYVRDNGMGIDPAYHEKVFGLFERLDTASEGTGVGLAVVRRIIEVHEGRIWVESEGLGRGSTFCFTIPLNEGKEASHGRD